MILNGPPAPTLALRVLDTSFFVFHSVLIIFVLVGWAWRKTRPTHLVAVALIVLSWFGLGIFFGIGYCPCTHLHWLVRKQISADELPESYLKFLLDSLTGGDVNATLVDSTAVIVFVAVALLSIWLNLRDRRLRRTQLRT